MGEQQFKVGDRVRLVVPLSSDYEETIPEGVTGEIMRRSSGGMYWVVEFGDYPLTGGWYVRDSELELIARSGREKVYLAGPMTGIPQFNFPAFKAATIDLRGRGYEVISPVEMDEEDGFEPSPTGDDQDQREYARFLARDIERIAEEDPDAIVVLPGWDGSGGAKTEVAFVQALKKPVLRYMGKGQELLPIEPRTSAQLVQDLEMREAKAYPYESVLQTVYPDDPGVAGDVVGKITKETVDLVHAEIEGGLESLIQDGTVTVIQQQHINGNPKDALAASTGKVRLDLLEPAAQEQIARALEDGMKKYGLRNFVQAPVRLRVYIAAMLRHIDAVLAGEDLAEDSGLDHFAHVGANVHIILAAKQAGTLIDDREAEAAA